MARSAVRAALACAFLVVSLSGFSEGVWIPAPLPAAVNVFRPTYLADQTRPGQPASQAPGAGSSSQPTPEPYAKDEFPPWLQDLWRAEIIFVGSLPFTYFYTLEGYDLIRYALNGFSPAYAPWPFQPATNIRYSTTEDLGLVITTITLSIAVTAADYFIRRFIGSNEKR